MAAKSSSSGKPAGIGDDAVRAKTGKTWGQWLKALDADGAKKMTHPQIAKLVHEKYGIGSWWCQMVTVGYEQARGLREKHETPSGYQISRSKTLPVPVAKVYQAWKDKKLRGRWLDEADVTVRKATPNKSIRITWPGDKTNVVVMFYPKGDGKSLVTVQHDKLPNAKAGERMKAYWGKSLERLAGMLESGRAAP